MKGHHQKFTGVNHRLPLALSFKCAGKGVFFPDSKILGIEVLLL
jgi:hypothetical protein